MIEAISQTSVLEALQANAAEHASRSKGLLVAYPIDWDNRSQGLYVPGEKHISRVVTAGNPVEDPSTMHSLAEKVEPTYAGMRALADQDTEISEAVDAIAREVDNNQNVFLGLGHNELMDAAFSALYVSARLRQRPKPALHRSGIVVSKGMDFLGINTRSLKLSMEEMDQFAFNYSLPIRPDRTIHILDFLRLGFNSIYRSIPDTATFAALREDELQLVIDHNIGMFRQMYADKKTMPPMLLAVAMSGSLTKVLDVVEYLKKKDLACYSSYPEIGEVNPTDVVEVAGRIAPAVSKFMRKCVSFAGGSGINSDGLTQLKIDPTPMEVNKPEDLPKFIGHLVAVLGQTTPNRLVLDMNGTLPVNRR